MGRAVVIMFLMLTGCAISPSTAKMQDADGRESFLRAVDRALSSRDAKALLDLSDVAAWLKSGRPQPAAPGLLLPPAPITRARELSESEALYTDGNGREWRLRFRRDERSKWAAVLVDSPCPRGGAQRGPEWERRSPAPDAERGSTWTLLECWPLRL